MMNKLREEHQERIQMCIMRKNLLLDLKKKKEQFMTSNPELMKKNLKILKKKPKIENISLIHRDKKNK
jgi:hypothetical protein